MASSGVCTVFAYITDFSSVTGEASHYMRVVLYKVPQKEAYNKLLIDEEINVDFDDDGYASVDVIRGTLICVDIPSAGFRKCFTVPDNSSFNVADLAGEEDDTTTSPIYVTQTDHGLLFGLGDDDHPQYGMPVSGNIDYILFPEFAGSVLYADGSNNDGDFTSDFLASGSLYYTFYKWTANQANQHGEIVFRTFVPSNLYQWRSPAIELEYRTGLVGQDKIKLSIYKQGQSSPIVEITNISSDNEWATTGIASSYVSGLSAGDEIIVRLECTAASDTGDSFVNIGKMVFHYIAVFTDNTRLGT